MKHSEGFIMTIEERIQYILSIPPTDASGSQRQEVFYVWDALRRGEIRAAQKVGDTWIANPKVKEVILWAFKSGVLKKYPDEESFFNYVEKDTLPIRSILLQDSIRVVPGGSSIRDGSYIAAGVIMMPPSYVNIGAYVDEGSMIDSHVLVGSCAQIGKRVHLSAAVQVGGVLEPINALPVIIEDDVMVGGNCGIYEGTIVHARAVLGTGVILNGSTPVYDLVKETIYRKTNTQPLEIPAGAVVVQGSRPARGSFAVQNNVHLYTPVIIKYRDEKTDAGTALEESLRE